MSTARGISLHIGVNFLDEQHYSPNWITLPACENDADTIRDIASQQGFETHQLKTVKATREAVKSKILDIAGQLSKGDFFLLSYSGHGGQIPDKTGDETGPKKMDDTWCLYDGQQLDDELHQFLAEFRPGVRVLVLSDSCYSGTILKDGMATGPRQEVAEEEKSFSKSIPKSVARGTFKQNKPFYLGVQAKAKLPKEVVASVKLLSGCLETEESYCNKNTSYFTQALKNAFNNGAFKGSYDELLTEITRTIRKTTLGPQTPGKMRQGPVDPAFEEGPPFKI